LTNNSSLNIIGFDNYQHAITISSQHCQVSTIGDFYYLRNLSRAGTFRFLRKNERFKLENNLSFFIEKTRFIEIEFKPVPSIKFTYGQNSVDQKEFSYKSQRSIHFFNILENGIGT
jgi:hypothetical protein